MSEKSGVTPGELNCKNLHEQLNPNYTDLGTVVTVNSGSWQCDYWEYIYTEL